MSQYATDADLRVYLPLDNATRTVDFGSLLTEISSGFDLLMGCSFGGDMAAWRLDGNGTSYLWLPSPAAIIDSVVEDGTTLAAEDYELDSTGLYLLRLDADNRPTNWIELERSIVVTYTPLPAPPILRYLCVKEAVRAWRGRQAGYADVVGVQGVSEQRYSSGFSKSTVEMLERVAGSYSSAGWIVL